MQIVVSDVYIRTGIVTFLYELNEGVRPSFATQGTKFGMVLYWSKSLNWLKVKAWHGKPRTEFQSKDEGLQSCCDGRRANYADLFSQAFLDEHAFLVSEVTAGTPLDLALEINTDDRDFLDVIGQKGLSSPETEEHREMLYVFYFDGAPEGDDGPNESATLDLVLKPARAVHKYPGYIAIDLGNTTSTLACLPQNARLNRVDSIEILEAEGPSGKLLPADRAGGALSSSVRIDLIRSWDDPAPQKVRMFPTLQLDESPEAIEWVVGKIAAGVGANSDEAPRGLLEGAKRRLVLDDSVENWLTVETIHRRIANEIQSDHLEQIAMAPRLPGELIFCRMLQRFQAAAKGWPARLAITYPTTSAPAEVDRLREVVRRAWLRQQVKPQSRPPRPPKSIGTPDEDSLYRCACRQQQFVADPALSRDPLTADIDVEEQLVRLEVDEASAASFFFLFRRIFESPLGLEGFRAQYDRGLNMLMYDCGGGTTDIALVRARADEENHAILRIEVLERSGERGFAGDNITHAVRCLLKAKIVLELAQFRRQPFKTAFPTLDPTGDRGAGRAKLLDFFIKLESEDTEDKWLPTRPLQGVGGARMLQHRMHRLILWRWAETLKSELEHKETAEFEKLDPNRDALSAWILRDVRSDLQKMNMLVEKLKRITISRTEVDALVRKEIERSIRKCNRLIEQTLWRPGKEEEVHWVVVCGNGSRYPLVKDLLRKQLYVAFVEDDMYYRFEWDPRNLKHAVAKGALMALMVIDAQQITASVEFDNQLNHCLPFSISYLDLATNRIVDPPLFREHEPYAHMTTKTIPNAMAPKMAVRSGPETIQSAGNPQGRTRANLFQLYRQFPGDDEYMPYLGFEFIQGITSELQVSYDREDRQFHVLNLGTKEEGIRRLLTDESQFTSPVEWDDRWPLPGSKKDSRS